MSKITKITPQIAAMYLGQKCDIKWADPDFSGVEIGPETITTSILALIQEGEITITPHLRRLESITEDECQMIFRLSTGRDWPTPLWPCKIAWWLKHNECTLTGAQESIGEPDVWLYLISLGFDLFGLIDAGMGKKIEII